MEKPNISYIKSMSAGDIEFEKKLVGIIKEEYPVEKKEYLDNISNKKYKLAASNVHKLKNKISILGLKKSYDTSAVFENNLLEGNTDLQSEFDSILDIITDYLEKL